MIAMKKNAEGDIPLTMVSSKGDWEIRIAPAFCCTIYPLHSFASSELKNAETSS